MQFINFFILLLTKKKKKKNAILTAVNDYDHNSFALFNFHFKIQKHSIGEAIIYQIYISICPSKKQLLVIRSKLRQEWDTLEQNCAKSWKIMWKWLDILIIEVGQSKDISCRKTGRQNKPRIHFTVVADIQTNKLPPCIF